MSTTISFSWYPKKSFCRIACFVIFLSFSFDSLAQQSLIKALETKQDTNFVKDYTKMLATRIYTSNKFSYFNIWTGIEALKYRPNDNWNFGIGFNYSIVGINIGINFPFINNDDPVFGETKFLDLQSHVYLPKLAIDFIGQYYKGFYLENSSSLVDQPLNQYYIRPDILTLSLGLSALYIFNSEKFSYRAFFLQNEWQKRSAGSFLFGGGVIGVGSKGDSSLFPGKLPPSSFLKDGEFESITNIGINLHGGYAHTFVLKSNWFVSASFTTGTGWGASRTGGNSSSIEKNKKFVYNINGTFRSGIGYNSERFFAGVSFVYQYFLTPTSHSHSLYNFNTGNFRGNITYRFSGNFLKKRGQKKIRENIK